MDDRIPWQPLLRESLAILALPAEEQIRINGPGCVSCDLIEDFFHARTVAIEHAPDMSNQQRQILDEIDNGLNSMQEADAACFDEDAIRRPNWQRVRELATEALRTFGWEGTMVAPFAEVKPGVWQRPPYAPERGDPMC